MKRETVNGEYNDERGGSPFKFMTGQLTDREGEDYKTMNLKEGKPARPESSLFKNSRQ